MHRRGAVLLMVAAGLGRWTPAPAAPLQSDDFKNGLAPFWKVHQIVRDTDAGVYGPAKAAASGGRLEMTSESDDIWFKKFQPFLVYQENITGAFDIRIQAISNDGTDSWSGASGLMILQSGPDKVVEADYLRSSARVTPSWTRDPGQPRRFFGSLGGRATAQASERSSQARARSGSSRQSFGSVTYSAIGRPSMGAKTAAPGMASSSARSSGGRRTKTLDPKIPVNMFPLTKPARLPNIGRTVIRGSSGRSEWK